ncbi:phosphodiesterase [Microbacterium sp. LRZ72]|uniref:phosphodiesterase n=1 Tax=Microbacterium sp. LRZ72 TaxID=2942481 RepID=UPI0029A47711|nr:phosphodiesterase [Microbacterium sp. LRZ72]MDX2377060.1 phosphodiesterase [Microbacterium sp. LRZ72]
MARADTPTRFSEYGRPSHHLVHLSDTHLRAGGDRLYGVIDAAERLERGLAQLEASGARPDALVFTGDLADHGEAGAYAQLRDLVEPVAQRMSARVIWVMGNHDDRGAYTAGLFDDDDGGGVVRATQAPLAPRDAVHDIDGLRVISLDTSVPGHHHGEVTPAQLDALALELATPAPYGTILAMHHPPVPSVLDLAATVELRDQRALAAVLRGTDVRAILAGHLHYSTSATFAGIPVSVASATCYTQDLGVPVGGTRPQDAAQGYNLVHVYDETIVHSVVAVGDAAPLEHVDADESRRRLAEQGVVITAAGAAAWEDAAATTRLPMTAGAAIRA